MHALVAHADIHDREEAKKGLDELLPMIKQSPGFVGAYFVRLDDQHGISVQVYETEEQARAAALPVGATAPGVTVAKTQFGEVIGSA